MRRVACIALRQIRVELARLVRGAPAPPGLQAAPPLAVVVARPGGSVKTERDVLGNTRLDVVSREARASGVRVGQTVAAARAKCAGLHVRVIAESAVRTGLERVAEVALAFGPSTAFDAATDVVWAEIGGCAHLHGGEGELAQALQGRVRALGHACRVSIADGPRIAAAVARFAPLGARGPLVVPKGKGEAAMRGLPVEALELEDECSVWLRDLGLRTCGDLQDLPKRSLGTRLGARTKDVMQLLSGEDRAPLDAWRPLEVPEERAELEWAASSVEALAFVARVLCERLAARLEGRATAAARIGLVLGLDRALLGEGCPPVVSIEATLPVPIVRAADLFAVVRARLEHVELPAPVLAVTLRALELSSSRPRPLDLLSPEPKAERSLTPLVAELAADLGAANVGTLALVDAWAPDERTRLVPIGAPTSTGPATASLSTSALEPSRLVHPVRRAIESFRGGTNFAETRATTGEAGLTLLARLEAIEWWRRPVVRRDFCAGWDGVGLAWVEVRAGEAWLRGWID
jgi:protein ImuB